MLGKTHEERLAERIAAGATGKSYWALVQQRYAKNRMAVWSLRMLMVLVFIGLFADFIANEKPLYCKIDGKTYFPVLKDYAVSLGLSQWEAKFVTKSWLEQEYQAAVLAPIPYSYFTQDRKNFNYVGPFDEQNVPSWRYRHWLGTDQIGRDIAAGLIAGARTALLVGLVAMSIAAFIGILMGAVAGYFGDDRIRFSRGLLYCLLLGLPLALFYGFLSRSYAISEGHFGWEVMKGLMIFLLVMILMGGIGRLFSLIPGLVRNVTIPVDIIVMRIIEILNSIPGLLLILAIVGMIREKSIFYVMAIIGIVRWTGIARFVRAELLQVRRMEYIEAARALGFSDRRILFRHAVPNALTPVMIALAFGIANAILLEAMLSFLEIGVPPSVVTWGTLLLQGRAYFGAWWLVVFPGLAIFVTVTVFNLIGEGLTEALDPKGNR